jgi:hypothetical protein
MHSTGIWQKPNPSRMPWSIITPSTMLYMWMRGRKLQLPLHTSRWEHQPEIGLATALVATPITYSTWAEFKDKFKEQFIPPQTQVESIQKIHNLPMGSKEFNEWYQEWSMHARRANVDKQTQMYGFRKNLNQLLHQKIIQMSLQPATMTTLVQAARDLDKNWRMFVGPPRSGTCHPTIRAVDDKPTLEINGFQGKSKKQGKLTLEERKHHIDNNLCLYCGKPGHKSQDCRAPPNKFPKAPI